MSLKRAALIGAVVLLAILAAGLIWARLDSAAIEETFSHCPAESKHLIEEKIGPVGNFDWPESGAALQDDDVIGDGTAIVGSDEYSFTCFVNDKSGIEIIVLDPTGEIVLRERIRV